MQTVVMVRDMHNQSNSDMWVINCLIRTWDHKSGCMKQNETNFCSIQHIVRAHLRITSYVWSMTQILEVHFENLSCTPKEQAISGNLQNKLYSFTYILALQNFFSTPKPNEAPICTSY